MPSAARTSRPAAPRWCLAHAVDPPWSRAPIPARSPMPARAVRSTAPGSRWPDGRMSPAVLADVVLRSHGGDPPRPRRAPSPGETYRIDSIAVDIIGRSVGSSLSASRPGTRRSRVLAPAGGEPLHPSRLRAGRAFRFLHSTGCPSASEAAFASTTSSPPSRPETTSTLLPSLRPTSMGLRAARPSATTTQYDLPPSLTTADRGHGQGVGVLLGDDRRVGVEAGRAARRRCWAGRSRPGASASPGRATRRSG